MGHAGVRGKMEVVDSSQGSAQTEQGKVGFALCLSTEVRSGTGNRPPAVAGTRTAASPGLPCSVPDCLSWGRGGALLPPSARIPSLLTGSKGNTGVIWTLGLCEASTLPAPAPTLHS